MLGLVRAAATGIHGTTPIASDIEPQVTRLTDALDRLASTRGPWPEDLREHVRSLTAGTIESPPAEPAERDAVTVSILRAAADDLAKVVDGRRPEAATEGRSTWQS